MSDSFVTGAESCFSLKHIRWWLLNIPVHLHTPSPLTYCRCQFHTCPWIIETVRNSRYSARIQVSSTSYSPDGEAAVAVWLLQAECPASTQISVKHRDVPVFSFTTSFYWFSPQWYSIYNMAPVLSAYKQTCLNSTLICLHVCQSTCQSFGFLSLYSERQCRVLQEMWEKEKKEEDLQQRTSGWSVDEASARSTCFQRVYLSVSRNYWTDFHFTWMEDESQCTLDHVIFCCGGISSHFLKRWQIMCGSGWEQFHSAPTMKIDGNSCWEGWNTVVSVWVGLKVRLLD